MKSLVKKTQSGEITLRDVQDKIIKIQSKNVLLDSDVAEFYGVETKRVNEAVKNNADKFPEGYIIGLASDEWTEMKSKISTSLTAGGKVKLPKAFTEKGLYMLATILKSERATATTLAIVEAFTQMREISTAVVELVKSPDDPQKQAAVTLKSNKILSDMVTKELKTTGTKTSFEFNLFSAVKIKHTIKKEVK